MDRKAILKSRSGQVNVMVRKLFSNNMWVVTSILDAGVTAHSSIFWKRNGGFDAALVSTYVDEKGKTLVLVPHEINEHELTFA